MQRFGHVMAISGVGPKKNQKDDEIRGSSIFF
jgi:hypothetical protein